MSLIETLSLADYPIQAFTEGQVIYLNFPLCWRIVSKRAKKYPIERYLEYVASCIEHETLHIVIEQSTMEYDINWTDYAEEYIVRFILDEKFPKYIQEYYKEDE